MTGEMQVRRREPCGQPEVIEPDFPDRCPRLWPGACNGCNGDGTRWVVVGTLRQVPRAGWDDGIVLSTTRDEHPSGADPIYLIEADQ